MSGNALKVDQSIINEFAGAYRSELTAATRAGVDADPEAQLTTPVSNLLTELAGAAALGRLELVREVQLVGSRPDFGAICSGLFRGWIELKKPSTVLEPEDWKGHNARQWKYLRDLDNLLLTNGREIRWFRLGELQDAPAPLPSPDGDEEWDAQPLLRILQLFSEGRVTPITSVARLARRVAPLARALRDRIELQLGDATAVGHPALTRAFEVWRARLQDDADSRQFSDAVAQVIAYSLVIAALDGNADANNDRTITLAEARDVLRGPNRVLAAALGPVIEVTGLLESIRLEVGAIEQLVSGVDAEKIRTRKDPRGEPWLWFYEDFLAIYDPDERKDAGVYYTPVEVVECITRLIDETLAERFGRRLGFADANITTLDPACGTGTFPLAVIDRGVARAVDERGPAGEAQAATSLAHNLYGFELLAGPYSVAHLRIAQRLRQLGAELPENGVNVLLADTLASPNDDSGAAQPLWGDDKVLADERERARRVKRDQEIVVILGNPPYDRVDKEAGGGWVLHGDSTTPESEALFSDVVKAANDHTIFSHVASLYNLYCYFWRWSIWKAFEAHGEGPAVIGMITGSHWLRGPGFIGLRQLALDHADEILVIDLGGDNKGAIKDENIFAIESPVAITLMIRHGSSKPAASAKVRFRRVTGNSREKLAALEAVASPQGDPESWTSVEPDAAAGFVPATGGDAWQSFVAIGDIFPWQQPGQMTNRNWPIAPHPELLERRWRLLLGDRDPEVRAERFVTAKTGRNIHTAVGGRARLADLEPDAAHEQIVRYAWRSFDRQWTFEDPRLAKTDSPALWQARGGKQVFLLALASEAIGPGPCLTVTTAVPDKHVIMGRGGKDVIPLYRDAHGLEANMTAGLPEHLAQRLGIDPPSPEDVAAYVFAIGGSLRLQQRFAEELQTPGLRLPITSDPALWHESVELGRRLLWLQTFAERQRDKTAGRGDRVPKVEGLGWTKPVKAIPATVKEIAYVPDTQELIVGDGVVSGVRADVWEFAVSGMQIVKKWLGYRTAKGTGRAATGKNELDTIRPERWYDEWNDELLDLLRVLTLTLDMQPQLGELVDRICDGEIIPTDELPKPSDAQRAVPVTEKAAAPSLFD